MKVLSSTRFGDSSGFSRLSLCFTDKGGKGEVSQKKVPTDSKSHSKPAVKTRDLSLWHLISSELVPQSTV